MRALWQSREQADSAADKLRTFAQPQRLMILSLLREGEKSVTEIDLATRIGQPALNQQLAELRKAELATARRQAKQIYSTLAHESVTLCVRSIEAARCRGSGTGFVERSGPDLRVANFARLR